MVDSLLDRRVVLLCGVDKPAPTTPVSWYMAEESPRQWARGTVEGLLVHAVAVRVMTG